MLRTAFQTLRSRRGPFVGTFIILMLAAAIATACGILVQSGAQSGINAQRYAGADLLVAADRSIDEETVLSSKAEPRLDASAVATVADVPGVKAAIADLTVPAMVGGPDGVSAVTGHPWSAAELTPMRLGDGSAPSSSRQVVLDAGLADRLGVGIGDGLTVQVDREPVEYVVSGLATASGGSLDTVYFTTNEAQRLRAQPGTVDAIGVVTAEGADLDGVARDIDKAASGADVLQGKDKGLVEFAEAREVREMFAGIGGTLGGIAMLVAVFVVASTLAVAVGHRHREIALLRATGATPRQVRRMIRAEAVLVGLVAGLVGLIPGVLTAQWFRSELVDRQMMPSDMEMTISWIPMLVAVGATVAAAWLGSWAAARRAAKVKPTEALRESAVEPRRVGWFRTLLGIAVLAGAIAVLNLSLSLSGDDAAGASMGTVWLLVLATSLLGPWLARFFAWLVSPILRLLSSSTGYLASANTRANARRLAGATTPLILAVALGFVGVGVQTSVVHASLTQTHDGLRADYIMTGAAIPPTATQQVAELPGVRSATSVVHTEITVQGQAPLPAQGVSTAGLDQNLDLDVTEGSTQLALGEVALSQFAQSYTDAKVGENVTLWLNDGTQITPRVAAIYERGFGFGDVTLARDLLAGHLPTDVDDAVLVRSEPGVDVEPGLEKIASSYLGVQVTDRESHQIAQDKALRDNAWLNYLLIGVLVSFTVVAMVNTLVMVVLSRARELSLLRLVGATGSQVRSMLRWESAVIIAAALVFGGAIAAATLLPFAAGLGVAPWLPMWFYIAAFGFVVALAGAAVMVPARSLLRQHAADAAGLRE